MKFHGCWEVLCDAKPTKEVSRAMENLLKLY
jgi:hypothetical protein